MMNHDDKDRLVLTMLNLITYFVQHNMELSFESEKF